MSDWRRYTTTPRPQVAWTGLAALAIVAAVAVVGVEARPPAIAAAAGAWLAGLVALGLRERRHWNHLVSASSFQRQGGASRADLQRIVRGHTVTVATDVEGILGGSYTEVSAPVTGVDASFTVRVTTAGGDGDGPVTGDEASDSRYAIQGTERNAELLLSPDVREALLAVQAPGAVTVSDSRVSYEVPFTRLTAEELSAVTAAVVTIVERVEEVGR